MATNIYESYAAFLARDNKKDNGVSVEFAASYATSDSIESDSDWDVIPALWGLDNETNEGCWNCRDCSFLTGCSHCSNTHYSQHCEHLIDCSFLTDCSHCSNAHYSDRCSYLIDCRHCFDLHWPSRKQEGESKEDKNNYRLNLLKKIKTLFRWVWGILHLKGKY